MSSDTENIPLTESITPPSLKNLSLEEEVNNNENKATLWEASVARNIMTSLRPSSPFPKQTSTLEDLQPNTDDDIIDVTNYSERPANDKRSPQPKQAVMNHKTTTRTLPHTSKQPHISAYEHSGSSTCQAPQN